jgi:3-hydroxyisobutyrate dehydrogenase-like beta-hydroxyacid dehydrogenase
MKGTVGTVIGVLHPGSLGAAVGAALHTAGHEVLWCTRGRSEVTARRADRAGLTPVDTVGALTRRSDVILSICPPHAAAEVAATLDGFTGVFVEANAISPETAREIARIREADGATVVDGGILGPPPGAPDELPRYRMFLSGSAATEVAALFRGAGLEAVAVPGSVGAASALKLAWASWLKGSAALLLSARALAATYDVEAALLDAWHQDMPELADRSAEVDHLLKTKGWRWPGEMEELAAAAAAAGLPGEPLYRGAAAVFHQARNGT